MKNDTLLQRLMTLVLPIAFQQFMLALVNASDAIMLGKLNQDSLSAVSLGGQIFFVLNLFVSAITIGENMYVAQYWGKGDIKTVREIVAFLARVTFLISAFFCISATFCPRILMRIFTTDETLIILGIKYLRIVGVSYLFSSISQIFLGFLKNCGKAIKSTIISTTTVVLNIVLNAVFIFGLFGMPSLGIQGAALATLISTGIGFLWSILYCMKNEVTKMPLSILKQRNIELEKRVWRRILPVIANILIWGLGFTTYSVIMGHLGTDAVAANSIANISKNLVVCFCLGLGNGGSIIVGNELGAGNLELAKQHGKVLAKMSIISGIVSGLFLLAITPIILHFTVLSPQAYNYLKWMLVMCSYYLVGKSINSMVIAGIFAAGGDSKFGMTCDAITLWCVTVPLGAIAAFILKWPVIAVYFVLNLDEIVKLPAVYIHFKKYKWVKDLTVKE
ncbi:MAG: MATE family efflux transporter [Lachnospiraceae bacterium]